MQNNRRDVNRHPNNEGPNESPPLDESALADEMDLVIDTGDFEIINLFLSYRDRLDRGEVPQLVDTKQP